LISETGGEIFYQEEPCMDIPVSTYRIQFTTSFGFKEMVRIIPYLAELGISHIYASPIFKARDNSPHGYDVVDHNSLNTQLGSENDFETLISFMKKMKMKWIQDIVPNHMAFDYANKILTDVLEKGQRSPFVSFFDIDWEHSYENIKGRVLAPFLGAFYGETLENGELVLGFCQDGLTISYHELKFPLAIDSYLFVLSHRLGTLRKNMGEDHPDFIKILGVLYVLRTMPLEEEQSESYDQARFIKKMMWDIYTRNDEFRKFLDDNIKTFNGNKDNPESFNLLDELLSKQIFRLSFWKIATKEINYRRFFNINGLISLMIQDETVFSHVHDFLFKLIREEKISGVRIDHIDGLYDPEKYIKTIRGLFPHLYLLVEKILSPEEDLPQSWQVQGTTGYDFMNYVNGIFCERKNERTFTKIYSSFIGAKINFGDLVREKKRLIIFENMAGDINNLAQELKGISSRDRNASDVTLYGLRRALTELLVSFQVYRTFISGSEYTERDREIVEQAIRTAVQHAPGLVQELNFIRNFLFLEFPQYLDDEGKAEWTSFAMRFQQYTGPLMAKGLEDTTLYVYNRLISLNEVGGNPESFGISVDDFHRFNRRRFESHPLSLNATSTHDTKRGEDVRARINVLSEIASEWEQTIKRWAKINQTKKTRINKMLVPDSNDEYFLYQTLVGAFPSDASEYPDFVSRIRRYIIKSVREAKVHTAWVKPDIGYEEGYESFIDEILKAEPNNVFLNELKSFSLKIAKFGVLNSLSQTLIKMTVPGIPDFYQGSELWDLNLVDPDNRRPVDFSRRVSILRELQERFKSDLPNLLLELMSNPADGKIKLYLIWRILNARSSFSDLFEKGNYTPIKITGSRARHLICFARIYRSRWSVTVAPRLFTHLIPDGSFPTGHDVWGDTELTLPVWGQGYCENVISGEKILVERHLPLCTVLESFPVALIVSQEN
jgi:(1->4)-alpha-D-glucan 1-alpha-D-glucosylmutase